MYIAVAMLDFYKLTEAAGGDRQLPVRVWRQDYRGLRLTITPRPAEVLRYSHVIYALRFVQVRMELLGFKQRTWNIYTGTRHLGTIDLSKIPSTEVG